jgi:hypothetical protein
MNIHRPPLAAAAIRRLCAAFALLLLCGNLHAQTNEAGRWLLIFGASPAMKSRMPGTMNALKQFLKNSADGEIREGDSMAVWTFDRQVQGSESAFEWRTARTQETASNLVTFLERQPFLLESSLPVLKTPLSHLVASSERLTTVIFCDGLSRCNFTPYDEGINQNFRDGLDERIKNHQPFVIVLRSQRGKYTGCTVNFPPAAISLPPFPPLPAPPPAIMPDPAKTAPVAAPVVSAPLVIVGTQVGTNLEMEAKSAPATSPHPVVTSNTIPSAAPILASNPPSVDAQANISTPTIAAPVMTPQVAKPTNAVPPTNPPVETVIVTQVVVQTIAPVAPTNPPPASGTEEDGKPVRFWLIAGIIGALVVLGIVAGLLIHARRPSQPSLISRSMEDDPDRK